MSWSVTKQGYSFEIQWHTHKTRAMRILSVTFCVSNRLARSLVVQEAAVKKRTEMGIKLVHSTIPDLFTATDPSTVLMRMAELWKNT